MWLCHIPKIARVGGAFGVEEKRETRDSTNSAGDGEEDREDSRVVSDDYKFVSPSLTL